MAHDRLLTYGEIICHKAVQQRGFRHGVEEEYELFFERYMEEFAELEQALKACGYKIIKEIPSATDHVPTPGIDYP